MSELQRAILAALADLGYPAPLSAVQQALTPELTRAKYELLKRELLEEKGWTHGHDGERLLGVTVKGYLAIGRVPPRPSMKHVPQRAAVGTRRRA